MKKYNHRDVKKLSKKKRAVLERAKVILSSGRKTLRRVFYMLASGSYDSLGKLLVWARLKNEVEWDTVTEEGRKLEGSREYNSVEEFLQDVSELYTKSKESAFKNYFEVWLEKATLRELFVSITDNYGVGLLVTRGRNSWTALKNASQRLDSNSIVLYFGDNDKHGNDMFKQNLEFLKKLGCTPTFVKLALTGEQEKRFKFPKGEHHLDGMPEEELAKVLEASIRKQINLKKFNAILEAEKRDKARIRRSIR